MKGASPAIYGAKIPAFVGLKTLQRCIQFPVKHRWLCQWFYKLNLAQQNVLTGRLYVYTLRRSSKPVEKFAGNTCSGFCSLKKRPKHRCFPLKLCEIFQNGSLQNATRWLLLYTGYYFFECCKRLAAAPGAVGGGTLCQVLTWVESVKNNAVFKEIEWTFREF